MYLSCNNAKILRYGAQKLYMFIIIIIWKEKENLTTILRQYLLLKLPSLLLLTNFSRLPSNICKIWLNPSEQSDSDPKNRRQIGDKRFPSIFEGVINPLRQEWRKRILKSRPRDPRFAEDADLNSPLTTRLLSAYYYLLPLQMAKRSPTGRSWNAFLFSQVLTAFRPAVAFPKWRHEWPQVQIMIRGTTSASRRCNRLLRSCYRPRSILPPWAFHLPPKRAPPSYTPPPSAILPFTPLSLPSMLAKFLFAPALRLHPLEFPIYHRKLFDFSLSLSPFSIRARDLYKFP